MNILQGIGDCIYLGLLQASFVVISRKSTVKTSTTGHKTGPQTAKKNAHTLVCQPSPSGTA